MNRVAIFAHWSPNNYIEDYVVYYLCELKKFANDIILVSDGNLDNNQLNKIKKYTTKIIAQKHGEYDFGSYKRGFLYAKENNLIQKCDELIFANDSCYAPIYPFSEMFDKMAQKNVDFWGATSNNYGISILEDGSIKNIEQFHIQSYFLVFKPNVFNSEVFNAFMNSIKKEENKYLIIINYEMGLSKTLIENGYTHAVYNTSHLECNNASLLMFDKLIKENRFPFLKRSIMLLKNIDLIYPYNVHALLKDTSYNYNLIKIDIIKNRSKKVYFKALLKRMKDYRRNIIRIIPREKTLYLLNKKYQFK